MNDKRDDKGERKPAAVLKYALRVKILAACDQREATPQEFVDLARGVTLANVNYHFSELAKWGFIYVTRKEQSGGSDRCYYRSLRQGIVSDEEFAEMKPEKRKMLIGAIVEAIAGRAHNAARAGTIDKRPNSHITWDAEWLDPERFDLLMAKAMELHEYFNQLKEEMQADPALYQESRFQWQASAGPARGEGPPKTAG
jgi:hypothetical protein